ncbi:MAG: hypothetical protein WDM71_09925 [Ferruginibacter sp.]
MDDKFTAFGCNVKRIDGHNFIELASAFAELPFGNNGVNVIIADTVRGKGLPSIEAKADRWFCSFTKSEADQLLSELHGNAKALLESETLIVR